MTDFLEYYSRHIEAVTKANSLNKPIVFDALAAASVTRVIVDFDGAGDSGQIDDITAYAGDTPIELPLTSLTLHQAAQNNDNLRTTKVNLRAAIETLCYDYLSQTHGGWENEDGASGTFEFDVLNRSIHLDFHERFMDVDTSCHDF